MSAAELDVFETARARLFGVAYRMLGSAAEAEDAVQDAFVRWQSADRERVREPVAWLTTVVTNLCLNRLTSARARREEYVGPWLPEPVLTSAETLGPLETVEQRESVSMGMLVLLERLTPPQRAAFVLREAFGYAHREIAEILDVSEASSQQLHHRARRHVERDRPRFRVTEAQSRRMIERFLDAAQRGDLAGLEDLLASEAVAFSDGGGRIGVARRPILGPAKVARYFGSWLGGAARERLRRFDLSGLALHAAEVNGRPGMVVVSKGRLLATVSLDLADDRIEAVHTVANPDKLVFIAGQLAQYDLGEPLASLTADS